MLWQHWLYFCIAVFTGCGMLENPLELGLEGYTFNSPNVNPTDTLSKQQWGCQYSATLLEKPGSRHLCWCQFTQTMCPFRSGTRMDHTAEHYGLSRYKNRWGGVWGTGQKHSGDPWSPKFDRSNFDWATWDVLIQKRHQWMLLPKKRFSLENVWPNSWIKECLHEFLNKTLCWNLDWWCPTDLSVALMLLKSHSSQHPEKYYL